MFEGRHRVIVAMTNGMRGQVIWDGYEMYIGFESNWEFNTLLNPDQVVCGGAE